MPGAAHATMLQAAEAAEITVIDITSAEMTVIDIRSAEVTGTNRNLRERPLMVQVHTLHRELPTVAAAFFAIFKMH